jgi:LysR family glycine cleavage system transcriptional activator
MDSRISLSSLRTFEVAARYLSFTKAARDLCLTQGAVSQQIKNLEGRLGFKLFRREVRKLELTDHGRDLWMVLRGALSEIDGTIRRLQSADESRVLTVSVGSAFAMNWLIPRLGRFREKHPAIDVRIHAVDDAIDLRSEGRDIDMMIRFSRGDYPDLHVTKLMTERVFVVCSPSLIDPRKPLRTPLDLCHYTLLHNEVSDREPRSAGDWNNWLKHLGEPALGCTKQGPRFPRCDMLVQAAIHGHGMALVWQTMVGNELETGRLVKAFGGRFEVTNAFYAVSTPEMAQEPKTRTFREWLMTEARSNAEPTDSSSSERRVNVH